MKVEITGLDSFRLIPEDVLERLIIDSWQKRDVSMCISVSNLDFIIQTKR